MSNNWDTFFNGALEILPGNALQLRLSLVALVMNRNILIEDVPGMGKTSLVKFFAKISGLKFGRIQFTSDLLPSDVLGVSIFNKETESFVFKPGPIFGELILADELNRGTPKTQSALLQAMEERQVTVDGVTYPLSEKFCLFATQNPRGQYGTYPLPESQLDRFLFKFSMGHLSREEEVKLLASGSRLDKIKTLKPMISLQDIEEAQQAIKNVKASDLLLDYLAQILQLSRQKEGMWGLSPRAGLDLLLAARAWAYFEKRDFLLPDDIQNVFPYVAGHRLFSEHGLSAQIEAKRSVDFISKISFIKK